MCGIFGIVVNKGTPFSSEEFSRVSDTLFLLSESRGKESSGVAIATAEQIAVFKSPTPASRLLKSVEYRRMLKEAGDPSNGVALVGHARLVTNGSLEQNKNNQPVIKDGIVGVHNGIIVNDELLWAKYPALARDAEVDTEVLLALIREKLKQGLLFCDTVRSAFAEIKGTASVGMFFSDLDILLLATNNGSLYIAEGEGIVLFASERFILEAAIKKHSRLKRLGLVVKHLPANHGCIVSLANGEITNFLLDVKSEKETKVSLLASKKRTIASVVTAQGGGVVKNYHTEKEKVVSGKNIFQAFDSIHETSGHLRRCARCILPETVPFISFNEHGICSVCTTYQKVELRGGEALENILKKYRKHDGSPDCAIMFSGGRDSSYGLHLLTREFNMHPVAYTYDWGMITDLGRRNQARMCGNLGVEHILVSADIRRKRENIRKNVLAWLKRPDLGMIPLFMAGDKQFFFHANQLRKKMNIDLMVMLTNPHEKTSFKSGFCGIPPRSHTYHLQGRDIAQLARYYGQQYAVNPAYLNASLVDTFTGFLSYYFIPHDYLQAYDYVRWDEGEIDRILRGKYDWELAKDAQTTWRIGDGTAPFYNFIYYTVAGFTENDALRSNQVREGVITREEALRLAERDNAPRWESMRWYFDTIGVDMEYALRRINEMPKRYKVQ